MTAIKWLEPWVPVEHFEMDDKNGYCAAWERQLQREVGPQHLLRGMSVQLIARRFDCDEALSSLANGQIAEVHLTWARGEEADPRWPGTALFPSIEAWAHESMGPLHEEWGS